MALPHDGRNFDRVQAWALANVETLAAEYAGVQLRRGRCACPIHGGDNPDAFSVANGKGWHCFTGECGSGDGVDLVRRLRFGSQSDKAGRIAALRELAPRAGVFLDTSSPAPRRLVKSLAVSPPSAPRVKEAPPWETELAALRAEGMIPSSPAVVHTSLSHHLTLGDRGAVYLEGRGLDPNAARAYGFRSLETAAEWEALRTFLADSYLPVEQTVAGVAAIPLTGRAVLVLPYRTADGAGWDGFRLRSLEGKEYRSLSAEAGYTLPLPFNAPAFARADEVHIVEGEMNAYTLHTYGVAALGLDGAKKWRPEWTAALRPVARLVAWYDDDPAGNDGWQKLTERLAEEIGRQWTRDRVRRVRIAKRDGCKDANDLHQRGELAPLLERAEWRTT
jgi:hypothetical protein